MRGDSDFTQSFDARDWARAFKAAATGDPSLATDEDTLLGWFSNAIMRGYDEAVRHHEGKNQQTALGGTP